MFDYNITKTRECFLQHNNNTIEFFENSKTNGYADECFWRMTFAYIIVACVVFVTMLIVTYALICTFGLPKIANKCHLERLLFLGLFALLTCIFLILATPRGPPLADAEKIPQGTAYKNTAQGLYEYRKYFYVDRMYVRRHEPTAPQVQKKQSEEQKSTFEF